MVNRLQVFFDKLKDYSESDRKKIIEAAKWAEEQHGEQKRASGEPYFTHPIEVAEILIALKMDAEGIIAALFHDVLEDTEMSRTEMRKRFGKNVELLVNGVTKISILRAKNKSVQGAETIRKMLFAMVKDIRVILIKLADKLHNMRTLEYLPEEKRKVIANECLEIYAPLAGRLGISWIKAELEDLSLKHLNPEAYYFIKDNLTATKKQRADYLHTVEKAIYKASAKENIRITIQKRMKHFNSIYNKMKKKKKDFDEIYDLLGIRILCNTSTECYTLLGIVHKLWPPIEGRFKDYIAMPKTNNYQSLHTTVMCYGGKKLEVQIRTWEMNKTAEFGIAAHWIYKRRVRSPEKTKPADLAFINKLKSWDGMRNKSAEFLEEIKQELLRDTIYVFTPKGDIVEMPKDSTPLDFAYHIHTEVGHKTVGAKADGVIIPITQSLKNTQVVEIITSKNGRPHLNWLRSVKTSRARSKIRYWLNKHDENLIIDRNIVAKRPQEEAPKEKHDNIERTEIDSKDIVKSVQDQSKVSFKVGNERNMMIKIANCCYPRMGDSIIGYVSRGRGIIVHKRDCKNLQGIKDFEERSIDVEWETLSPRQSIRFHVKSRRSSDLFSEIEGAVRKYKGHLIEGRLEEDSNDTLDGFFTMEIENKSDLKKISKSIRTIPSVININEC